MLVKTKFNIGSEVYFRDLDKQVNGVVNAIQIIVEKLVGFHVEEERIKYNILTEKGVFYFIDEERLYSL